MIRRLLILLFIASFAISTTGFTYTVSNCKMAKKQVRKCLMCKKHKKDNGRNSITFLSSKKCCSFSVINKKVNDSFVSSVNNTPGANFVCILNDHLKFQYDFSIDKKEFSDTSPPVKSNSLYLQNSILLI